MHLLLDQAKKAEYAWRLKWKDRHDAHCFPDDQQFAICRGCGRTRKEVRWDGLPPQCSTPFIESDIPKPSVQPTKPTVIRFYQGEAL